MNAEQQPRRDRLRRVLLGSAFGVATALICPQLPEEAQMPCRFMLALIHAWVNT